MKVFLVQHGRAVSKQENPERPLTEAGVREAHATASFIARSGACCPARIYHSGKKRAEQTASALSEHLYPRDGIVAQEGLSAQDDPGIWAERLNTADDEIVLVGHLPHLNRLASLLLTRNPGQSVLLFKNAGMVCLERSEEAKWSVCWAITPGLIAGNSGRQS